MDANEMPKAYEPGLVEDALYAAWVKSGYFSPENLPGDRTEPFSIVLPPPNVTGTLHMGHAVMLAIEDAMVRIARLQGKKALWIPGTDHAAIATQSKVEKMILKEEGKTRHDLGREPFLRRVEQFARDSHDIIVNQTKKMGASIDWSREAYTLDETRSRAVRVAFKKLYELGLIYRGFRVVNWDPIGQTTISDDEMVYKEGKAMFYTFRYGKNVPIAISTTRPETKVGDTAIAVHPEDARYKDFIGQSYTCDFAGTTITVRVIADEEVDPAFGTGALGVTPAHSSMDADMAKRHNVPMIQVIGEDACMLPAAGPLLDGKSVKEAREEVVNWLRESGLLEKEEEIDQNISTAERTGGIVEPLPKLQWFIDVNKSFTAHGKTATLKERMIEAVEGGAVNILPDRFNKTYFHWINNLRDWCISRQIWFGHRIPVWYRGEEMVVDSEAPAGDGWEQDSDTLDTWFSSGLWTFSTLGWPETKIIFVRHGQAASNVAQIVDSDVQDHHNHLTEKGKEQISALAEEIKSLGATRIIASPVLRTRETADILSGHLGLPMSFDNRLREVGGGIYEGAKAADYEEARGDVAIWRENHAGGIETFEEVKARAEDFIREAVVAYAGETIIVVSHGDPLGLLQTTGTGLPDESRMGAYPKTGGHMVRTFGTNGSQRGDLSFYHPTSVLETGYDIIFFWVARMILMSTALIGEVPFKTVYLHGLVRDEQGRKMSKSLDNIINPLDMIAQYGADATRLSLVIGSTPGNDSKLSEEKVAGFRNFTNKLWNISRFVFLTVGSAHHVSSVNPQTLSDRWILGRLSEVIEATTRHASRHEYSLYGEVLREFTWGDFADWYLEIAKIEKGKEEILLYVLERILVLWHPFMPFVTEEIYKQFENGMLIVGEWPKANHTMGAGDAAEFARLQTIITDVRNLRATYKLDPKVMVDAVVAGTETEPAIIRHLARINNLTFGVPSKDTPSVGTASVAIYLPESFDPTKEKARLSEELADAKRYAASVEAKLNNQEFAGRAPAAVIEKEKQKLAETTARIEAIEAQLKTFTV